MDNSWIRDYFTNGRLALVYLTWSGKPGFIGITRICRDAFHIHMLLQHDLAFVAAFLTFCVGSEDDRERD